MSAVKDGRWTATCLLLFIHCIVIFEGYAPKTPNKAISP